MGLLAIPRKKKSQNIPIPTQPLLRQQQQKERINEIFHNAPIHISNVVESTKRNIANSFTTNLSSSPEGVNEIFINTLDHFQYHINQPINEIREVFRQSGEITSIGMSYYREINESEFSIDSESEATNNNHPRDVDVNMPNIQTVTEEINIQQNNMISTQVQQNEVFVDINLVDPVVNNPVEPQVTQTQEEQRSWITMIINKLGEFMIEIWSTIVRVFKKIINWVKRKIANLAEKISRGFQYILNKIAQIFGRLTSVPENPDVENVADAVA